MGRRLCRGNLPRVKHSTLRRGEIVKFCSRLRPDMLPRGSSPLGKVLDVGSWSILVAFNDFPDEPLRLGLNEVKRPSGVPIPTHKQRRQRVDYAKWYDWDRPALEDAGPRFPTKRKAKMRKVRS